MANYDVAETTTSGSYPVFIVGMPRSGTKLLRELLNNHPDISLGGEGNFIPRIVRHFGVDADTSQPRLWRAVFENFSRSAYYTSSAQHGVKLTQSDFLAALASLREGGVTLTWSDIFEALLRPYGPRPQSRIYGDKSHGYLNDVALVRGVFRDVRFIHLVRDPRDQALSALNTWGRHPLRSAHQWAGSAQSAERADLSTSPDALTVRYEDLTGNTERELERVCEFLQVRYLPDMSRLAKPAESERKGRQLKTVVSQREKYKAAFSPRLIRRMSEITLPYLAVYSYPDEGVARHRPLGSARYRFLSYMDGLSTLRFHVREKGVVNGSLYYFRRRYESMRGRRGSKGTFGRT